VNPQIADAVASVDRTFLFIFGVSVAILVGITAAMIWFVFRYSRKRNPRPADFDGNLLAEILWTVLPTLLVLGMFFSGWSSYRALRDVPPGAMEVKVAARMWSWSFEYANGKKSNVLWAPLGEPVKLSMQSSDVIHGFFAPAFRIKQDVVPGVTTYAWFKADQPGDYDVFCSVYCGLQHAKMLTTIKAVPREEFAAWLDAAPAAAGAGRTLLAARVAWAATPWTDRPGPAPPSRTCSGARRPWRPRTARKPRSPRTAPTCAPPSWARTPGGEGLRAHHAHVPGPDHRPGDGADPGLPGKGRRRRAPARRPRGGRPAGLPGLPLHGRHHRGRPQLQGAHGPQDLLPARDHDPRDDRGPQYVLDQLAKPEDFRVKGFDPIMPAYPDLTDAEKEALLRFLESLSDAPGESGGRDGHGEHAKP
jgi:cytochrome c oxidase subunit 2